MADDNYLEIARIDMAPNGHLLEAKMDGVVIGSLSLKVAELSPKCHQDWVNLMKESVQLCLEDVLGIKLDIGDKSQWEKEKTKVSTDPCEQMEGACRPPSSPPDPDRR